MRYSRFETVRYSCFETVRYSSYCIANDVVLLLLIYCFMLIPVFWGLCVRSLFCNAVLSVISAFFLIRKAGYLNCLLIYCDYVLMFYDSKSKSRVVCSVLLWYLLVILDRFCAK